jgi:hypothetical protein
LIITDPGIHIRFKELNLIVFANYLLDGAGELNLYFTGASY